MKTKKKPTVINSFEQLNEVIEPEIIETYGDPVIIDSVSYYEMNKNKDFSYMRSFGYNIYLSKNVTKDLITGKTTIIKSNPLTENKPVTETKRVSLLAKSKRRY